MRLIDFFDRGAALFPDEAFLSGETGIRTYRQTQQTSHSIAKAIIAAGLSEDATAAVYSSNDAAAFECVIGIFRSGCAWVPINPRNAIGENIYSVGVFDVEIIFYHSDYESQVGALRSSCPRLKIVICIDSEGIHGPCLERWIAPHFGFAPELEAHPESAVIVFSTGGTTGRPKGAVWTNRVFETMIANFFVAMPVERRPVHLAVAPLTHAAGGFALMVSAVGGTNIILKQTTPLAIMEAIERERVTHLFLPPTVIYLMLAHPRVREFAYSSLEHFIYAAAPMSVEKLKQAIEIFGPVMTQVFGQAEAPIMCTYLSPEDHVVGDPTLEGRLASCGRPTLLTPVEIMDDAGNLLSPGEKGEIVVRGNLVMKGYYKDPVATKEVSAYGWHHTADVGYKDAAGFVYIVDRKKDMIISGGFNVYPSEVEQVIWAHPAVQDCAVIGVPHEKWGEAVKAIVELKSGCSVSDSEIIAFCKQQIGSVKAPKSVEFWESLPRTAVGKVRKRDIRARFWEGIDRKI